MLPTEWITALVSSFMLDIVPEIVWMKSPEKWVGVRNNSRGRVVSCNVVTHSSDASSLHCQQGSDRQLADSAPLSGACLVRREKGLWEDYEYDGHSKILLTNAEWFVEEGLEGELWLLIILAMNGFYPWYHKWPYEISAGKNHLWLKIRFFIILWRNRRETSEVKLQSHCEPI